MFFYSCFTKNKRAPYIKEGAAIRQHLPKPFISIFLLFFCTLLQYLRSMFPLYTPVFHYRTLPMILWPGGVLRFRSDCSHRLLPVQSQPAPAAQPLRSRSHSLRHGHSDTSVSHLSQMSMLSRCADHTFLLPLPLVPEMFLFRFPLSAWFF